MMTITNKQRIAIASAVAFLLVVATALITYKVAAWRWGEKFAKQTASYEKRIAEIDRETNRQLVAQQVKQVELNAKLSTIEQQQYQELSHEKTKNDQLINDLATARRRLSVATSSCATSSGSVSASAQTARMDHAETRAYINSRDATAIIAITRRGDEAIRQLNACQEILSEMTR